MTAKIETAGTRAGLRMALAGIVQAAGLALRAGIEEAEKSAKGTTRFKDGTGETRGSIRGQRTGNLTGFVQAGGAARFLEDGTKPHWIGSAVPIRTQGGIVFRYIGMHPGTSPRPFMHEARDRAELVVSYAAEYYCAEAIARAS